MSPEDEEKLKARIWWAMPGNKYTNDPTIEQITEALLRLLQQHQTERRGQSKALVRKSHEIRQLKKQIEALRAELAMVRNQTPMLQELEELRAKNHKLELIAGLAQVLNDE